MATNFGTPRATVVDDIADVGGSGSTETVNYPSGTQAGDFLLLLKTSDAQTTSAGTAEHSDWTTPPSGWTDLGVSWGVGNPSVAMFYRFAGTETSVDVASPYNLSSGGAFPREGCFAVVSISGVDSVTPIEAFGALYSLSASTTANVPHRQINGLTDGNNYMIIYPAFLDDDRATVSTAPTDSTSVLIGYAGPDQESATMALHYEIIEGLSGTSHPQKTTSFSSADAAQSTVFALNEGAASTPDNTVDATFTPSWSASASGAVAISGDVSATFTPAWSADVQSAAPAGVSGDLAATFTPAWSASVSGSVAVTGYVSATFTPTWSANVRESGSGHAGRAAGRALRLSGPMGLGLT